ncbi:hypothetical protein RJ640_020554 [Escallonia rubra]|uniref:Interferon-related developmental regulator N-terminal domain-containing protein n=1 Tax=Escallonia rubra TaxID=112253 RepID=A0AA88U221_9ASTE|nr:hypothetical protein RJ640_020554 [Escallonia rubra]
MELQESDPLGASLLDYYLNPWWVFESWTHEDYCDGCSVLRCSRVTPVISEAMRRRGLYHSWCDVLSWISDDLVGRVRVFPGFVDREHKINNFSHGLRKSPRSYKLAKQSPCMNEVIVTLQDRDGLEVLERMTGLQALVASLPYTTLSCVTHELQCSSHRFSLLFSAIESSAKRELRSSKILLYRSSFATLLYRCLSSFKKGSLKETCLALEALGWLAITVGCGENAHELYEELLPPLSQALKSLSEPVKLISILDCLAIVTFVGGCTVEETERSMQIVWDFIHSGTGSSVRFSDFAKKHSAAVQIAAISACAVSFFLDILEADDGSLHIVACEALALIFEMGCLEKFASGTDGTDASSIHEGNVFPNRFSSIQELREKLLVRARALSLLAKVESSTTLSVKGKHNTEWDVLIILELNFLKRLLGGGFVRHMLENQLLHDVFDFTPKAKLSGDELYVSEREEIRLLSWDIYFKSRGISVLLYKKANI